MYAKFRPLLNLSHWHILLDQHIPHKQLRRLWNKHLARLGYIQAYRRNQEGYHRQGFKVRSELLEKWPAHKQRAAYFAGRSSRWSQPNTVDIHALRNVQNVVAYVVKYMSKNGASRNIEGRIWGCNDTLKNLSPLVVPDCPQLEQVLAQAVHEGQAEKLVGEGFTFYRCQTRSILQQWHQDAHTMFVDHWSAEAQALTSWQRAPAVPDPPPLPTTCRQRLCTFANRYRGLTVA